MNYHDSFLFECVKRIDEAQVEYEENVLNESLTFHLKDIWRYIIAPSLR